ncbi:MAG: serine/threonine-protein phosphatase [Gammaproteobacteria bacterium]|nr:serine/threonine-protein phosphatase [Gammaproteobacteria bacterium]
MPDTTTKQFVCRSDRGLVRAINEDSVGVDRELGLVVLADGMGGYQAGEIASALAVSTITGRYRQQPDLEPATAVVAANQAILAAIAADAGLQGMGTTLVIGRFDDDHLHYAHVGDSRLYRWRDGELRQLTNDHSMIQQLLDEGRFPSRPAAIRAGVKANLLTRGVGLNADLRVDSASVRVRAGDRFLFCSDGLSNMLSHRTIARVVGEYMDRLEAACDRLLRLALERGGYDNVSLALVGVGQASVEGEAARGGNAV